MSRRFESKKDSILKINRLVEELESDKDAQEAVVALRTKYENLRKKYDQLDRVFSFHKGIIQNISAGIVTVDLEGRVTFANRAALQATGYKSDEILSRPLSTVFADKEEGQNVIRQILNDKKMFESRETQLVSSDGQSIPIGFSTTLLYQGAENKPSGVIFIFRDISDLNNFRKQMARMDRLATLGELSAGIAHEIRNPLAGIKTSAQVLEESFSPGDFRSQLVSRIVKEIDRSNKLLQRFFNFAKPSRPKPQFHSLVSIIDGVYLLLANRLAKRKILFEMEIEENLPPVFIDESQFEQVILNLFLNAMDAMQDGGKIKVAAHMENTSAEGDPATRKYVRVEVRDNGKGIEENMLERIFNPFFTTKSNGVGLGLSITSRLLDENNCKIEVSSTPGKGSVFTVLLPHVAEEA